KPAAEEVVADLERLAADLGVEVSWATLGRGLPDLTAAVERTLTVVGAEVPAWPAWPARPAQDDAGQASGGGSLRGLFCGGTLADEAMIIAEASLGPITSNIPLAGSPRVSGNAAPAGH